MVEYQSYPSAANTVHVAERPQLPAVTIGTGLSHARTGPSERFALLIREVGLTEASDGVVAVALHYRP